MSTALIVVIVVAAVILLALLVMLPRMRATARQRQAERELHSRRSAAADEHRGIATEREDRAEQAEQKARMAEQAAQRERAEAKLESERADMHERGLADDELIDETERDRFRGVADRDAGERAPEATDGPPEDNKRFDRDRITDDIRESERPRR
jgi:uncharacterized protein HemY